MYLLWCWDREIKGTPWKTAFFSPFLASVFARTYTPALQTPYRTDNVCPPCAGQGFNDFFGIFQHNRDHLRSDWTGSSETFSKTPDSSRALVTYGEHLNTRLFPGLLRRHVHQTTLLDKNPRPQAKMRLTLLSFLSLPDPLSISTLAVCLQ